MDRLVSIPKVLLNRQQGLHQAATLYSPDCWMARVGRFVWMLPKNWCCAVSRLFHQPAVQVVMCRAELGQPAGWGQRGEPAEQGQPGQRGQQENKAPQAQLGEQEPQVLRVQLEQQEN